MIYTGLDSDINKTFFDKTKTLGLKTKTKIESSIFFQDQGFLAKIKARLFIS